MSDAAKAASAEARATRAFSRLLDEALNDAVSIRAQAETLAADVLVAPPHKIYESAVGLEERTHEGRTAMGRLVEVMRRAHLHTLETAYRALSSKGDREEDAEKLRRIINEYRRVRAVMDVSRGHIEAAMGTLTDQRWRSLSMIGESQTSEYVGSLIAKA
jgi:hypothetical protein